VDVIEDEDEDLLDDVVHEDEQVVDATGRLAVFGLVVDGFVVGFLDLDLDSARPCACDGGREAVSG
jgi:hypothetical protein